MYSGFSPSAPFSGATSCFLGGLGAGGGLGLPVLYGAGMYGLCHEKTWLLGF